MASGDDGGLAPADGHLRAGEVRVRVEGHRRGPGGLQTKSSQVPNQCWYITRGTREEKKRTTLEQPVTKFTLALLVGRRHDGASGRCSDVCFHLLPVRPNLLKCQMTVFSKRESRP